MSTQLCRSTKLAVCFVAISFTGCAAISSRAPTEAAPEEATETDHCTLMFVSKNDERERVTCPLDGSPTIQKVLEAQDALGRYRRVIVRLYRQQPGSPVPVRMDVQMDSSGRRVQEAFNYTIHPGDKILVKEDPDGPMDDLLKKLGPLSRMAGY